MSKTPEFRKWLRKERETRGWSQPQLAEMLGVSDYRPIWRYESGRGIPNAHVALVMCELFDVEPGLMAKMLPLQVGGSPPARRPEVRRVPVRVRLRRKAGSVSA